MVANQEATPKIDKGPYCIALWLGIFAMVSAVTLFIQPSHALGSKECRDMEKRAHQEMEQYGKYLESAPPEAIENYKHKVIEAFECGATMALFSLHARGLMSEDELHARLNGGSVGSGSSELASKPTELSKEVLQAAVDDYVYVGMRHWARINLGTMDIVYWQNGGTQIAHVSMRYVIKDFNGCSSSNTRATCNFSGTMRIRDEFNYGDSTFHNRMKTFMHGLSDSYVLKGASNLRWDGEKWKVQTDPRRLFQF